MALSCFLVGLKVLSLDVPCDLNFSWKKARSLNKFYWTVQILPNRMYWQNWMD